MGRLSRQRLVQQLCYLVPDVQRYLCCEKPRRSIYLLHERLSILHF